MNLERRIDKLKEDRWNFLKEQNKKIQKALDNNEVSLACKLFEEYGRYESTHSSEYFRLTHS